MREAKIEVNLIVDDDLTNLELAQRFRVTVATGKAFRGITVESVRCFDRFSGAYPQDVKPPQEPPKPLLQQIQIQQQTPTEPAADKPRKRTKTPTK